MGHVKKFCKAPVKCINCHQDGYTQNACPSKNKGFSTGSISTHTQNQITKNVTLAASTTNTANTRSTNNTTTVTTNTGSPANSKYFQEAYVKYDADINNTKI